jgi:hypothetical protein
MWCCFFKTPKASLTSIEPKELKELVNLKFECISSKFFVTVVRDNMPCKVEFIKRPKVYCGFINDFSNEDLLKMQGKSKSSELFDNGLLYYAFSSDTYLWLKSREEALELKNMIKHQLQSSSSVSASRSVSY